MESFHRFRLTSSSVPPAGAEESAQERPARFFMQSLSGTAGPVVNGDAISPPPPSPDGSVERRAEDVVRCLREDRSLPPTPVVHRLQAAAMRKRLRLTSSLTTSAAASSMLRDGTAARIGHVGARPGTASAGLYRHLSGWRHNGNDPLCRVEFFAKTCWGTELRPHVPSSVQQQRSSPPPSDLAEPAPAAPAPLPAPAAEAEALAERRVPKALLRRRSLVRSKAERAERLRRLRQRVRWRAQPLLEAASLGEGAESGEGQAAAPLQEDGGAAAPARRRPPPVPRPHTAPLPAVSRHRNVPPLGELTAVLESIFVPGAAARQAPPSAASSTRRRAHRWASAQAVRLSVLDHGLRGPRAGLKRLDPADPRVAPRRIIL
eukprot:TRINITY_DN15781_c0_g1_i1.p1 TRINITY_DN15781_c0_g1~~TRINITY_DN15781_c0_g1_i1.p1  ORF type:complete len:399 (+),score=77.18 TRINITY_DN15781_c0_g1_i1:72-1199(+)